MTKVDFTNWLHSELDAVFHGDITPEQVMLKAIPMIDTIVSQNSSKPIVSGRSEQLTPADKDLKQMFHNMSDCYSGLDMHDEKTEIVPSMSCERFMEAVKMVVTGGNCH